MKDNEITITETLAEIEKHRTEYAIQREEEEEYVNHSYRDEQMLMQAIKDGNVNLVERLLQTPMAFPQAVEGSPRKNEEYMTAIWVGLVGSHRGGNCLTGELSGERHFLKADCRGHGRQSVSGNQKARGAHVYRSGCGVSENR